MMSEAERKIFELGKAAGIAEEHLRNLKIEMTDLKKGQRDILDKMEALRIRLEELNNWRWMVVGAAAAVAFVVSWIGHAIRDLFR